VVAGCCRLNVNAACLFVPRCLGIWCTQPLAKFVSTLCTTAQDLVTAGAHQSQVRRVADVRGPDCAGGQHRNRGSGRTFAAILWRTLRCSRWRVCMVMCMILIPGLGASRLLMLVWNEDESGYSPTQPYLLRDTHVPRPHAYGQVTDMVSAVVNNRGCFNCFISHAF
jgi:hypothetical protein